MGQASRHDLAGSLWLKVFREAVAKLWLRLQSHLKAQLEREYTSRLTYMVVGRPWSYIIWASPPGYLMTHSLTSVRVSNPNDCERESKVEVMSFYNLTL